MDRKGGVKITVYAWLIFSNILLFDPSKYCVTVPPYLYLFGKKLTDFDSYSIFKCLSYQCVFIIMCVTFQG